MSESPLDFYRRLMLAPISGVTDRAVRRIARELGCRLTFSELISAVGLCVQGRTAQAMLESCLDEHPLVVQLFGREPGELSEATKMVDDLGPDGIDLNLGCPVKRVVNHGSGMALVRDTKRTGEIIAAMRQNTHLPLSVKMRAGWDHDDLTFLQVARIAQEEGADGLILHARTRKMGFSGDAHWPWIAELKAAVSIPVVGNGDVIDGPSAARMLAQTGCDGIMVGRASLGNPWIFAEIQQYLTTGQTLPPATLQTRVDVLTRHLRYAVEDKGQHRGVQEMRKQIGWYLKGFPNVKELRQTVNRLDRLEEVIAAIRLWAKGLAAGLMPIHHLTPPPLSENCRFTFHNGKSVQQTSDLQQVENHPAADLTENQLPTAATGHL